MKKLFTTIILIILLITGINYIESENRNKEIYKINAEITTVCMYDMNRNENIICD